MKPEPKDNLAVLLYAAYASWVTESNILLTIEQSENKDIGKYWQRLAESVQSDIADYYAQKN
tara:strand:- start:501 stop:686 length:186 start_codon:yes stop_codon:yes gene_type:complete